MKRIVRWMPLLWVALALSACGRAAPLAFAAPSWADGEFSRYDVLDPTGAVVGTTTYRWTSQEDGWLLTHRNEIRGKTDGGEVLLGADLLPLRSWREAGSHRVEAAWTGGGVTLTTTEGDETSVQRVDTPGEALDNECTLQLQRALPLAAGYTASYINVVPLTGGVVRANLRVRAAEPAVVPAGTVDAWRVDITFGSERHQAWYARSAPHLLLRYRNPSGGELQLRAWSPAAGEPLQGDTSEPAIAGAEAQPSGSFSGPDGLPLSITYVVLAALVQFPLMIVFPLALGWWLRRRYDVSWGMFGAGALTFLASQVVHLPINYALGLLGGGRGMALWPLPLVGLVAGLTSGLSEELARYVGLRVFWRRIRGWAQGVQYGAGHGAVESVIFGVLALITVIQIVVLYFVGMESLGITGDAADQVRQAFQAFAANPAYLPVLAGLERVFAIIVHVFMASLVMRSLTRGNLLYLLAAIGTHTVLNWWAVVAAQSFGYVWTEVGLGLLAAGALYLIIRMGRQDGALSPPRA